MLWQRPATAEVFRGTSTINSSSSTTTSPPTASLHFQNRSSNEASGTVTTPAGSKNYPGGGAFDLLGRVSSLSAVIGDPFTRKTFLHQHHKPVNSLVEGTAIDGGRPDVNVALTAPRPHTANASNSRQIKSLKELKQDMSDEEHARLFYQPQQQQQSKTTARHPGEGSVGSLFSSVKTVSVMSGDHRSSSGLQQRPATANATLFFSMQRDQRGDCTTSMMRKQSTSSVLPGDSTRRTQQGGRVSPPTNGTASAGATVVRPASAMLLNTKAKLDNLLREEGAALMAARDEQQRKEAVALAADNVAQRVRPLSASDSDSLSSSSTARAAAYQPTPDDRQQIRYLQQQLDAQQQQHEAGAVTDVWDDSAIDPKMFSAAPTPDPQALQPPWHTSTSPSHGSAVEGTSWRSASGGGSVPRPTSAVSGQNPLNSWSRPTSAHDAQQVHRRPPPAPRATSTASSMNGSGGLPPTSRSVSPSATLSAMSQFDKSSVLVPKIYLQQQSQQQQLQQARTQQQVSSIEEQPVSPACSTSPDCLVIEHENNPYHQPLDVAHQLASDGRHTANSDEVTSVMVEATKPAPTLLVQHENDADVVRSRPASAYAAKFRQKLMEVMSEPTTPQKRLVQNDDNAAPLQKLDPTSTGIGESFPTDVQRSDTIAPRVVPVSDDIAAFLGEHFFSLKDLQDELRRVEGVLAEGASSAGRADD